MATSPDRISGRYWEKVALRGEYYRCVTEERVLLRLYRDGVDGGWYLYGYWD